MKILVLNAGSSSQKSCLYELTEPIPADPPAPMWEARIEWNGASESAQVTVRKSGRTALREHLSTESRADAIRQMLDYLCIGSATAVAKPSDIDIVGHRIVHGGEDLRDPTFITPKVKTSIAHLSEFAPLHNLAELEGAETIEKILGPVPQVAVFDTAFHSTLPAPAAVYPGPYEWLGEGIRRYGFHGINHQYCAQRAAQLLGKRLELLRVITCHLGNGCSLAAVRNSHSIDTTMGFTPLDGLMMGSRSGSVDPGILLHLIRKHGYSANQLDEILNKKSGLLGISGISSDMREVLMAMAQGDSRAKVAFEMFIHRLRSHIGSMLAALGGLDALVFTAGIGENSPAVREAACDPFVFLGVKLDPERNAQSLVDQDIAASDSAVRVLIIRAQEDWAIAQECWNLSRADRAAHRA